MKYEADIRASRDFVWATFDDPNNLSRWQPTLESFTHQAGEPGRPGAVSELAVEAGTVTRTFSIRALLIATGVASLYLAGTYDNAWATTLIVNHFDVVDDSTTRFVSYTNMKFKGIMRIMALFVARSIRSRAEADLNRFKLLVETESAEIRQ